MANSENDTQLEEDQQELENQIDEQDIEQSISQISEISRSFETRQSANLENDSATVVQASSKPVVNNDGSNALPEWVEKLARPKRLHLQETLANFGSQMTEEKAKRIKMFIDNLEKPRNKRNAESEAGKGTFKVSENSQKIYDGLQSSLRRVAFETLANRIYDKIPEMILMMEQSRPKYVTPERKALLDTLESTLYSYLGKPGNEHEMRVFQYLHHGLTSFVENMIEFVHKNQEESNEKITSAKSRFAPTVELARKVYKIARKQ
ncbi:uncharacterized protein LOC128731662 [Anopheles nili]|uniref:uncharacterized protein LOC128731662 n=1 Tax=Anopheles nili TaxID=185578 RepID=UPI00237B8238|nr:uncharacterized protein LOC128731662 [Anopheles nili]